MGRCLPHMIHNSVKLGIDSFSVNIPKVIVKVYSFFRKSAQRRDNLIEIFKINDENFKDFKSFCRTRFLSIENSVCIINNNWASLVEYFKNEKHEKAQAVKEIVNQELCEVTLLFVEFVSKVINKTMIYLEKKNCLQLEISFHIKNLLNNLKNLKSSKTIGIKATEAFKKLNIKLQTEFNEQVTTFYDTIINYLTERLETDDMKSQINILAPFALQNNVLPTLNEWILLTEKSVIKTTAIDLPSLEIEVIFLSSQQDELIQVWEKKPQCMINGIMFVQHLKI